MSQSHGMQSRQSRRHFSACRPVVRQNTFQSHVVHAMGLLCFSVMLWRRCSLPAIQVYGDPEQGPWEEVLMSFSCFS